MQLQKPSNRQLFMGLLLGGLAALSSFFIGEALMDKAYFLFFIPFGIVGSWICILYPHATFLLIVALIPLDAFASLSEFGASLSLFKLLTPLVVIGYLRLMMISDDRPRFRISSVEVLIAVYTVYCLLLIPFAEYLPPALTFGRKIVSLVLLYFLSIHLTEIRPQKDFQRQVLLTLLISSIMSGLFSFYTTVLGENIFSHFQDSTLVRTTGASDISPNDYAYVIFLPIAIALLGFFSNKGSKRIVYALAFGVLSGALVLTYSRSAIVAIAGAFIVLLFFLGKRITSKHLVVMGCLLLVGIMFLPQSFKDRMMTLVSFTKTETTGQELSLVRRSNYYVISMAVFKKYPLLGAGPGNFPALHASSEFQNIPAFLGSQRMPHSLYLQVLTETGVVGLIIFFIPLITITTGLAKQIRNTGSLAEAAAPASLMLALLSSLSMGLFLHLLLHKSFWIVLSLCTLSLRGNSPQLSKEK